ncbi:MAG: UDP-3-O-acyl-N-acetylglucosamine deacetylase, partial [Acidobacteria bacterium]|nr:UDP-3-O-acyl-N-acetylglucosamine deacetylase [Acidobacteriota bacterium]
MNVRTNRRTLSTIVAIEGVGLHSGLYTKIDLRPAAAGDGVVFIRTDLRGLRIPAHQSSTTALDYATSVGVDDVSIGTVEHLLAAVAALRITDLEILIDGPEVPIIDGSAAPFVHLIDAAGIRDLNEAIEPLVILEPIHVEHGDKWIRIEPADELSIRYTIDFPHPSIGLQSIDYLFDSRSFEKEIAPARTYGFMAEVEKLRSLGLARGGSVENCIVLDDEGITNGPLRFQDEFVRHKIGDLVGDLAVLGGRIRGHIVAERPSHAGNFELAKEILAAANRSRGEGVVDITKIMQYLPHRYPMLL